MTRRPAAGQARAGEERVAAVVAGADEQRDPAAVRRGRAAAGRRVARPVGGALHERALGRSRPAAAPRPPGPRAAVYSPITRRPARGQALGDDHGRGDAAVVAQREVPGGDPELGGAAGHRPADLQVRAAVRRRRSPRRRASAGRPGRRAPWPAPPWPRTARPATHRVRRSPDGVCCSAAVNSRSRSPGVRVSDSANRSTGTTSIPTPMITRSVCPCRRPGSPASAARRPPWAERCLPGLLDGDGLGQVARLVDVEPRVSRSRRRAPAAARW